MTGQSRSEHALAVSADSLITETKNSLSTALEHMAICFAITKLPLQPSDTFGMVCHSVCSFQASTADATPDLAFCPVLSETKEFNGRTNGQI